MSRQIVLLHPLGSDKRFWDLVHPDGLPEGYLAVDLPGHGAAAEVDTAELADYSAPVVDLLEGLRQDDPHAAVGVVGVSLGGLVAQHVAARYSGLVDWAAFVDTVPVYPGPMRQMWRERAAAVAQGAPVGYLDPTLTTWFSDAFCATPRGREATDHVRAALTATRPSAYRTACEVLERADETSRLGDVDVPVLVVCGDQDGAAFQDAMRTFEQTVPVTETAWLEGRHASVIEDNTTFVRLLEEFAERVEPGATTAKWRK